jgi:hypothetical protein
VTIGFEGDYGEKGVVQEAVVVAIVTSVQLAVEVEF